MEEFLARWGLVAVFLGAAFEGDMSVVLAGVVAHLGFFTFPLALQMAWIGGFVGDSMWYGLGRMHAGTVERSRLYLHAAPVIARLVARLGAWEIVLSRFVYGTRIASMFYWGVRRLPFIRFAALDLIGCLASAALLAGLGFVLSESAVALVGRMKRAELWLLSLVVVGLVALGLVRHIMRRLARAP